MGESFSFLPFFWSGGEPRGKRGRDVLTCWCVGSRRIRKGDSMKSAEKSKRDIYGRIFHGDCWDESGR